MKHEHYLKCVAAFMGAGPAMPKETLDAMSAVSDPIAAEVKKAEEIEMDELIKASNVKF